MQANPLDKDKVEIHITRTSKTSYVAIFNSRLRSFENLVPHGVKVRHFRSNKMPVDYQSRKGIKRLYLSRIGREITDEDIKRQLFFAYPDKIDSVQSKIIYLPDQIKKVNGKEVKSRRAFVELRSNTNGYTPERREGRSVPFNMRTWLRWMKPPMEQKPLHSSSAYKNFRQLCPRTNTWYDLSSPIN